MGKRKKECRTSNTRGRNAENTWRDDAGKSRFGIKEISYRKEIIIKFLAKWGGLLALGIAVGFMIGYIAGFSAAIKWGLEVAHRYGIELGGIF